MACEKTILRVFGILTFLLLQSDLVWMRAPAVSCSAGEAGFLESSLIELIHYSDVVFAGRVIGTERGEFGIYNAEVSYFFAYKTDGLLARRIASYTTVVGFTIPPVHGQLNLFFLMRQPTTMKLSLLCMSNSSTLLKGETINYIKVAGRNDTIKVRESGPIYPDQCDLDPGVCGHGASCTSLVTPVGNITIKCACYPGFYRKTAQETCQPLNDEYSTLYCSACSHNAHCKRLSSSSHPGSSYNKSSSSHISSSYNLSTQWTCTCNHLTCEGVLKRPLCGSDGQSYEGECQMKLESCKQQKFIYRVHYGICNTSVARPCMGMGEPLTTSTGLVNCKGPNSVCPAKHFCHYVEGYYSACCPVLHPVTKPTETIPPTTMEPSLMKTVGSLTESPTITATPATNFLEDNSGDGSTDDENSGSGSWESHSWGSGIEK